MNYTIDILKLICDLLPSMVRMDRFVKWMYVLLKPVRDLFADFDQFRADSRYELSLNGTVISLERMLNDKFDPISRGILIIDPLFQLELPSLFLESEQQEESIDPWFLESEVDPTHQNPDMFLEDEFGNGNVDFIVQLPSSFLSDPGVSPWVEKYKMAPFRFKVEISSGN